MVYYRLKRLSRKELKETLEELGVGIEEWQESTGVDYAYDVYGGHVDKLPEGAERCSVYPVLIVVHDRVFDETCKAWKVGNEYYVSEEDYEECL